MLDGSVSRRGPRPRQRLSVRRDDNVMVLSGKDRGKRGKVLRVDRINGRVVVQGVGMVKRHTRANQKVMQGGIIEQEGAISASAVMVVCPHCKQPARLGHTTLDDGRRVRRCVRCGEPVDR